MTVSVFQSSPLSLPCFLPSLPSTLLRSVLQVQPTNSRSLTDSKKGPLVLDGFQGCLDSVMLNDNELPLQNKRSRYAEVVGLTELKLGCVLYPDACLKQPCLNGATCTSLPSGGESPEAHENVSVCSGGYMCGVTM